MFRMINVIGLYEDLRKYVSVTDELDDLFYDAPEGHAQIDVVKDMLTDIISDLERFQ